MAYLRLAVLCLVVTAVARPVSAQEIPGAELSGGYQLLNYSAADELVSLTLPRGWYLDAAGSVNKIISIVGEVGGAYKSYDRTIFGFTAHSDLNTHQFMGGIRLNARQPHVVSFGQVLAGGVHGSSTVGVSSPEVSESTIRSSATHFALEAGGGVNVLFTDNVGVRIGADYLHVFPKHDETTRAQAFRFVAGIVVPFGVK